MDAGFSRAQLLEVVLGVGLTTLSNYTNHLVGTAPANARELCAKVVQVFPKNEQAKAFRELKLISSEI